MNIDKIKAAVNSFLETRVVPLDTKKKYGICAVAWVAPIVAFVFLFYSPHNEKIRTLRNKQHGTEKELKKVMAHAKDLDKQKAELADTELKYKAASALLPQAKEIPSLLTNISSLGTGAGLDFVSFQPKKELIKDFYAEIPIDITVRGPYHNIGAFLDRVSKLDRIVSVANINMGAPVFEEGEALLNSKISLTTYRFIEPGKDEGKKKTRQRAKKKKR